MAACRSSLSRWSGRRATAGDIRVAESYGSDQYFADRGDLDPAQRRPVDRPELCAARTAARTPIWGSTSGTTAPRSCACTSGPPAPLPSSAAATTVAPLPAGTKLTLSAVGSTISFQQNGTTRIAVTDSTLTGGAPGRDDLRRGHRPTTGPAAPEASAAAEHVFGWWDGVGVVGDGGVAGQRWR